MINIHDNQQCELAGRKLAQAIEQRLQSSEYHALRGVRCEYHEGTLVLRGRVKSYFLKQLAQEKVRHMQLRTPVRNSVEVLLPESHN